jgi:hypothetical protein
MKPSQEKVKNLLKYTSPLTTKQKVNGKPGTEWNGMNLIPWNINNMEWNFKNMEWNCVKF